MKLQLGDLKNSKEMVAFLEKSTRAMRELIADNRRKLAPNDLVLDRGMELSRMKRQAADMLSQIAVTDDEKASGTLGVIEALSQMASFGDVAASDELRVAVDREIKNSDPRVAQQAKSIALSLLSMDYQNGSTKSDELIAMAELVLASGVSLSESNLNALSQATELLASHSEDESAMVLAKKTEEAFRDHPQPQVAIKAWEQHASRIEEMKKMSLLMNEATAESRDPVQARAVVDAIMNKIPSPWTAFFLMQVAIKIEFSGRPLIAQQLVEVAESQIDKIKVKEARDELAKNCEQFRKRTSALNKPMNLSGLVDTEGKPIDLDRYKGKVVLVDFWASWCGPCIEEIPNIESVFSARNKDGFEVIGVNLDENTADLTTFLQSKKLNWATYVSSDPAARGFETPLAQELGISAIPFVALIGKDGNVAAIHVRGSKIAQQVAEQLAKE